MQLKRHVLIHSHIYKNAGSSIERLLWSSFGDGFAVLDTAPGHETIDPQWLNDFLAAHPYIKAISSHRIHPPINAPGALPLVMLRHPADRAHSAYRYARATPEAADHVVARDRNFRDYVAWSLATRGDGAVLNNQQVRHLSNAAYRTSDDTHWRTTAADLDEAKSALLAMPAFGLVRRFGETCRLVNTLYRPYLPSMCFREWAENTTGAPALTDAEALARVRHELGAAAYDAFCEANAQDMELYRFAGELFDRRMAALARPVARAQAKIRFFAGRVRQRLAEPELYRQWPGCEKHPSEPAVFALPGK